MGTGLRMTEEELAVAQARIARSLRRPSRSPVPSVAPDEPHEADEGLENKLLAKAINYCNENGLPVIHDNSRGKNRAGTTDLIIAAWNGATLWIELKGKAGRLSQEQKQFRLMLMHLGHKWYEARSYRHFVKIVEEYRPK